MEKQELTTMVILDLSAPFDTDNHDILLTVLKNPFGKDGEGEKNGLKTISDQGTLNYVLMVTTHPQKN